MSSFKKREARENEMLNEAASNSTSQYKSALFASYAFISALVASVIPPCTFSSGGDHGAAPQCPVCSPPFPARTLTNDVRHSVFTQLPL